MVEFLGFFFLVVLTFAKGEQRNAKSLKGGNSNLKEERST